MANCYRCGVETGGFYVLGLRMCHRCQTLVDAVMNSTNDWYMAGPEPYHAPVNEKATANNDHLCNSPVV